MLNQHHHLQPNTYQKYQIHDVPIPTLPLESW
jgi:hypothetical protein